MFVALETSPPNVLCNTTPEPPSDIAVNIQVATAPVLVVVKRSVLS